MNIMNFSSDHHNHRDHHNHKNKINERNLFNFNSHNNLGVSKIAVITVNVVMF